MVDAPKLLAVALLMLGAMLILIGSGSTFGARCSKAFPDSGLEQERCVERLVRGERI